MQIQIDQNHLLTIDNPSIPQIKEYSYNIGGYIFSDYDKGIIVLHKKQFKIINLKNLGDGMASIYLADRSISIQKKIDSESFVKATSLFQGFDEETGKKYVFLPKCSESNMQKINVNIAKLGFDIQFNKTNKGVVSKYLPTESTDEFLSELFALTLLHGKLDIRKGVLMSFQIHLPLSGASMIQKDYFDQKISQLRQNAIFVKTDIVKNSDGIIYQISGSDYEILSSFANFYKSIENIEQINTYTQMQTIKSQLIDFIQSNSEIPNEGKNEVIQKLRNGTIKLLTK